MKLSKCVLASMLAAGALALLAGAFDRTNTYTPGQFTDVPETEWYASEVATTYELGLMQGVGGALFDPNGQVTVAEAVTMAARASAIHAGETINTESAGEWYAPYIAYATDKGFLTDGQFDNYNRPAKRHEVASLFENAMPEGYFTAKNDVTAIPDIPASFAYAEELLTLYKAGVVMGSDSYGNFRPEDNITRAEAAAIIGRVALPEKRLQKTLDKISADDAYVLVTMKSFNSEREGISSGWLLDNRGGVPRTFLLSNYGTLTDISEKAGTAYIREFNKTTTGLVSLSTSVTVSDLNGIYLEYQNDTGDSVYCLQLNDGAWQLLGADGSYSTIYTPDSADRIFTFQIDVDLDNNRSLTYINDVYCGTYPLATSGDASNLFNFRFATTEEETAICAPGPVSITVNYPVKEDAGKGWLLGDGTVAVGSVDFDENVSARRHFNPVSGTVVAEAMFLLPSSESISFALQSGDKQLVNFTTDSNNFYANGVVVYENYYANLWYRLRIEANTEAQTALIKINGRKVGEVSFAEVATSADNIIAANNSDTTVRINTFKVFRTWERNDYVPVPVVPKGEEKYTIGMNVCPLWTNGEHFGWHCITPFDDIQPVLGYYDESKPETADWEIKYLVEHGIDFQAFCIYFEASNGPQKLNAGHLYDGFMNAKYSDMSKFCVIWEAYNAQSPYTIEAWKNDYVPYFIENFFKDPRYMTIDNRLVLCVFGDDNLANRLGSRALVKEGFEYMEEEVKKLGFDGLILLACSTSGDSLAEMGFDGSYAYNWGQTGNSLAVNKTSNLNSANSPAVYTVPTISVGFNEVAWAGNRYPLMTLEDYATAHEWVKTEYLPTYAKEDWQKNFVMLSTWNEYGEGTYIMPTNDEKGFGYIDVIREAYTDEKIDASLNTIPNNEQQARINRMYPQYRRLLRKDGSYNESAAADFNVVETLEYGKLSIRTDDNPDGMDVWGIEVIKQDDDGFVGRSVGDAILKVDKVGDDIDLSKIYALRVTAQIPEGESMRIFFTTTASSEWSHDKSVPLVADSSEMKEYLFVMSGVNDWSGTLMGLRFDPIGSDGDIFTVKSLELLSLEGQLPKKMTFNGMTFDTNFSAQTASNGDILVAFDPAVGMDFRLNAFHVWDKEDKKLTLNFIEHTVVYTVGSSKYTVDGIEKSLGYALPEIDGLPLVPIKRLCEEIGYTYTLGEDGIVSVDTAQKSYFEATENTVVGSWEFEKPGDSEGWSSVLMNVYTVNGYMTCTALTDSTDPIVWLETDLHMPAERYTKLSFRVRYNHVANEAQPMVIYFITDKDQNWSEDKSLRVILNNTDSNGEWEEYSVETALNPLWKDNIIKLRFDPFNAPTPSTMDVDYIRFDEDPDYVYVPPKLSIINGDAEDESRPDVFASENADLDIYKDPEKGNVWRLSPRPEQAWVYIRQNVRYTAGARYKVTVDVKVTGTLTSKDVSAQVYYNAIYTDSVGKTDHNALISNKDIQVSDGWKTYTFEFQVPEDALLTGEQQFAFYANPIAEESVGYMIDNLIIEQLD